MTPFRGEKNTNWEGGWRVPSVVRLAGPGSPPDRCPTRSCIIWIGCPRCSPRPAIPTSSEAQGGWGGGDRAHLQRASRRLQFPAVSDGQEENGPRKEIFYFSDEGDLTALRYSDWKLIFMEQKAEATLRAWIEPWTPLRVPLMFNLRRDPYERSYFHVEYLLRLADRPRFLDGARTGFCREISDHIQRISAAAESGELHRRSGDGETRAIARLALVEDL